MAENKDVRIDRQLQEALIRISLLEANDAKRKEREEEMLDTLHSIQKQLERYRGVIGGVLLVFTCIGTFFKLFGADILRFMKGGG